MRKTLESNLVTDSARPRSWRGAGRNKRQTGAEHEGLAQNVAEAPENGLQLYLLREAFAIVPGRSAGLLQAMHMVPVRNHPPASPQPGARGCHTQPPITGWL